MLQKHIKLWQDQGTHGDGRTRSNRPPLMKSDTWEGNSSSAEVQRAGSEGKIEKTQEKEEGTTCERRMRKRPRWFEEFEMGKNC
ncbi:hypothetical protein L484_021431 [Morus notabilis]|uniref:Uncharacterized protein n=1 Tax=Morus notabilis TaxID=981085 RepID=W9RPD2_9ROSA|nr:hypothetical protein L484_021431 [Morus notabilis]